MTIRRDHLGLLLFVICCSLRCTSVFTSMVRLGDALGSQRIVSLTTEIMDKYQRTRSRLEPTLVVHPTFWVAVRPRIADTLAPSDYPERFLRVGFTEFLRGIDNYLSNKYPHDRELPLNAIEVRLYLRSNPCVGSPCRVPPCCGNGARCWSCQ